MLGLFLAACNQGLEEDRIRIGFSQCFDDHPFRSKMNDEMRIMAALYPNVELIIKEASGSHEKQVGHVDSFIDEGLDVIIVSAVNGDSISPKNEPFWV
jgi:ABC-type sugar transport system substrate-binding protein